MIKVIGYGLWVMGYGLLIEKNTKEQFFQSKMAKNDPKIASWRKYAPKMQNAKSRDIYIVYIRWCRIRTLQVTFG